MPRLVRMGTALAWVALSLGIPLILVEIGLRLFAPQTLALNVSEWDPNYGWRNRPGARGFFSTPEFRFEIQVNSLGHRGPETARAKPPGTFRILGLGDSFALGHGVDVDSCFLSVTERELERRAAMSGGGRIEVLNAGVGKWGTAQEYLYLTREGLGLEPDLVVLAFCVDNDFENNRESSVLRLEGDRLVPVPSPEPTVRAVQRITRSLPGYEFLTAHSHLVNFLRVRATILNDRAHATPGEGADSDAREAELAASLAITIRIMDALVAATRGAGVPLAAVFIPSFAQSDPERWATYHPALDMRPKEAAVAELSTHLDSLGVSVLDPLPHLREASRTQLLYLPLDIHLNAAGSRILGQWLAEQLTRLHLIAS
jgi:hypothetical protein